MKRMFPVLLIGAAIRLELGHAELDKPRADPADQ